MKYCGSHNTNCLLGDMVNICCKNTWGWKEESMLGVEPNYCISKLLTHFNTFTNVEFTESLTRFL